MIAAYRPATGADAPQLLWLRRRSILALAPAGMPVADAQTWAAKLDLSGMDAKLREMEIWLAEVDGRAVGWGAVRGDRLEGLYVDPEFARRGIGSTLLARLEKRLWARDIRAIRADASANAEAFYARRGYEPDGPLQANARPMIKRPGPPAKRRIAKPKNSEAAN